MLDDREAGVRLDLLLHRKYPMVGRAIWQLRIKNGDVLLNDRITRPSRRGQYGDVIEIRYFRKKEPEVNRNYKIIYEDDAIIVVDKPPNLPIHPSGIYFQNTLYMLIMDRYGDDFTAHFINRIDRETSGLLLMAGSPENAAYLQKVFRTDLVRKEYLVIVEGRFENELDTIGWITSDRTSEVNKKRAYIPDPSVDPEKNPVHPDDPQAQSCRTEFIPERYDPGENISLIRCRIHTGRMHQIRATLQSLGYPVVGDRLYGIDDRLYLKMIRDEETQEDLRRLRISRTALHSHTLSIPHPVTKRSVSFTSPLPEDMERLFRKT